MDRLRKIFFKWVKYTLISTISITLIVLLCDFFIRMYSEKYIYFETYNIPDAPTVLVPGAMVWSNGTLSGILEDRVNAALLLYNKGKVKNFLLSGDHREKYYDEVNAMKNYLLNKGVPEQDITLDHTGIDTYSSIARAKYLFEVQNVIIVTQEFHLSRAIFIARMKKLKAYGFISDNRKYKKIKYLRFREKLANIKAIYEIIFHDDSFKKTEPN